MDQDPAPRTGFQIGRIFGAPVIVHWLSLVVMVLFTIQFSNVGASGHPAGSGLQRGLTFTLILFTSLFLHELAHAAVGTVLRRPVREIAITIFGAHTAFARPADSAFASGLVAAVGPATNASIAGLVAMVGMVVSPLGLSPFFELLVTTNLLLAAFNALPGYPLDGGRVLEAIAWAISGRQRVGTIVAAWGGLLVACGTVAYFVLPAVGSQESVASGRGTWGVIIGVMIGSASVRTLRDLRAVRRAEGVRLSDFVRPAVALPEDATVADAVERAQKASVEDILILSRRNRVLGNVSLASAQRTPEDRRAHRSLYSIVDAIPEGAEIERTLAGRELLTTVRYWRSRSNALAVMDGDEAVGVLVLADLGSRLA